MTWCRHFLLLAFLAAVGSSGCTRRVPIASLADAGGDVGVVMTLEDGENVRGRLVSFGDGRVVVESTYELGTRVELRGFGERKLLFIDGAEVEGEIVSVERSRGSTIVRLRRVFAASRVVRASFFRSGREASLAPVASLLVGPVVGGLLAFAF